MTDYAPVRVATVGDEEALMRLCRLLHEENGLFEMNEARVRELLRRGFVYDRVYIGVIEDPETPGKLVGCILLYVEQMWYSDQYFFQEIFNFVDPEHRSKNYVKALIAFAKSRSDKMQIPLMIGVISNKRTEAKIRLYAQQLTQSGAFFIHNEHLAKAGAGDMTLS